MKQARFSPLLLFLLLPGFYGCFSTDKKGAKHPVTVDTSAIGPAPSARTPEEAVRQLLEANSRYARHESRWLQLPSSGAVVKPFALVVNAGAGRVVAEEIFDLPRGSVPTLAWNREKTDWNVLDASVRAGVKVVLVMLPYRAAERPGAVTATFTAETTSFQKVQSVCRQLQAGSSVLSGAVAQQRCQLLGAMLDPATQRLICLPSSTKHMYDAAQSTPR
jgi:hypothetical protein